MNEITVGDKLWYVPADRRHGKPKVIAVEKIGRKYIYAGGMKCQSWDCNGYAILNVSEWPYGSVYLCERDHIDHGNWDNFTREIDRIKLDRNQKERILEIAGVK